MPFAFPNCAFDSTVSRNDGTNTPLPEYKPVRSHDAITNTHTIKCSIEAIPGMPFSICVRSSDQALPRVGVILFVDDVEQNRVGLRPGYAVRLNGRPISANEEQPFRFMTLEESKNVKSSNVGTIRIELWRSIVTESTEGAVTYAAVQAGPLAATVLSSAQPSNSISRVSKVQYLDKHPLVVFIFECRSRVDLIKLGYIAPSLADKKENLELPTLKKFSSISTSNSTEMILNLNNSAGSSSLSSYPPPTAILPTRTVPLARPGSSEAIVKRDENLPEPIKLFIEKRSPESLDLMITKILEVYGEEAINKFNTKISNKRSIDDAPTETQKRLREDFVDYNFNNSVFN